MKHAPISFLLLSAQGKIQARSPWNHRFGMFGALLSVTLANLCPPTARAQAISPAAPGTASPAEAAPASPNKSTTPETVVLSPFEVASDRDHGYTATNTLTGGRLSTDLQHTPAAMTVMTRELLDDLGINDVQEALQWATNVIAASETDVSGDATISNSLNGQPDMAGNGNAVSIRGFGATIARNYFPWFVNSDSYNTERIDISRGANALVFGDAASGGVVNVTTKRAKLGRRSGSVQFKTGDQGTRRVTADVNLPLTKIFALRVNTVAERSKGWNDYFKLDRNGAFGALTLNVGGVQIRGDAEYGLVDRRSPATYLRDRTSSWNGVYTLPARLTGNTAPPAGAGVARVDTGANANRPYNVMDLERPELGFLDWQGSVRTNGLALSLEKGLPERAAAGAGGIFAAVPIDEPAQLGRREFRTLPYYGYGVNLASYRGRNEYRTYSLFLEKRVGDKLFIEAAGALQSQNGTIYTPASHNSIYLDVNEFLPAGVVINGSTRNPNFLKPFNETSSTFDMRAIATKTHINEARLSAVYLLEVPFTRQRVGHVYSLRERNEGRTTSQLNRINGANPDSSVRDNQLFFRTYLPGGRDLSQERFEIGHDYNLPGGFIARFVGNQSETLVNTGSAQAFANGTWFKGKWLTTLMGVRRDDVRTRAINSAGVTTSDRDGRVNSPSMGVVLDPFPKLSLFGANPEISFYASTSKTFISPPGNLAFDFERNPLPLRRGKSQDLGMKFNLWDGRISGSVGYYVSEEQNNSSSQQDIGTDINTIRSVMGLASGGTFSTFNDTVDSKGKGYEVDVTANVTRGWSVSANFSVPESILSGALPRYRAYLARPENRAAWEAYAANPANSAAAQVRSTLAEIDLVLARQSDGMPRVNQTDYSANFFTRYRVATGALRGLSFGGGVKAVGRRLAAARPGFSKEYTDAYSTTSALLGYSRRWQKVNVGFQLNVSNVFAQENFSYTGYLESGIPQLYRISNPRALSFSATFKF